VDGCTPTDEDQAVYQMGPGSYILADYPAAVYRSGEAFDALTFFFNIRYINPESVRHELVDDVIKWFHSGIAPPAVDDLRADLSCGDVLLTWSADPKAARYVIYRSSNPETAPGDSISGTTDTTFLDTGSGAGNPGTNSYYMIEAVAFGGARSEASNRVGEFDTALSDGE